MKILRSTDRNFQYDFKKILKKTSEDKEKMEDLVDEILDDVMRGGDTALLKWVAKYDKVQMNALQLELTKREWAKALKSVSKAHFALLERAAERIEAYHKRQLSESWEYKDKGISLGQRITPIERVGIYVPGGTAAYPSTVLMNAIPARVAGVDEICMTTPWSEAGCNPHVLAAAKVAGVDRIFKVGGAQAIAAFAYGTGKIPKVDKIVGPGNRYVVLAKKRVYGEVGIDLIAGPSEVLVIGDGSVPPSHIAADLLSQAEHDEWAGVFFITDKSNYIMRVEGEIRRQLLKLKRRQVAEASLKNRGMLILTRSLKEACELANRVAPEHLELAVEKPEQYVDSIRHAGAIFLGAYTPEALGDYMAGPSHVLPTQGTARFFNPLGVYDFQKRTSIISCTEAALRALKDDIMEFAGLEGLGAHAQSVAIRFEKE